MGKASDVLFRLGDRGAQRFIRLERRGHEFGLRHGKLVRPQRRTVKFLGKFQQRVVTAHINVMQDGARALFDPGVEQAGGGGQFAELAGKIRVGVANHFHTGTG